MNNELIMQIQLLEAHIAQAVVVNTNTNEVIEMTNTNVVSTTVNKSIVELNDDCMQLDSMYEWYVLVPVDATTTIINGVYKQQAWEYRMVGEELVAVLDEGDVVYVNTCDVQNVRKYHKQLTGNRVADAIFFCTEEMDMVEITMVDVDCMTIEEQNNSVFAI